MHTARLRKLLKDINDVDASKRRTAAEALSAGDVRAVYPLIRALRDDNLGVQDAAMRSLMAIKEESTAHMVLPLLRENSFLRNTALIILKEMGQIAVPLLYILLNDRDDDIRKFALDLIHDIKYCTYPEKLVAMLAADPNPNVRAAAAKTLGNLRYTEALPQLIKALNDEEWVCFSVLEALADLRDEASVDIIIGLLNTPSDTIRVAAIESLGRIGSSKAVKYLTDHLAKTEGFEKNTTIKSLVRIGVVPSVPGIKEAFLDMLREEEWDDKLIAIKGLVALKADDALYPLIDTAGSFDHTNPENEERLYIIKEAISSFNCHRALIELLDNSSVKYRGRAVAIEVIGNLKCREAVSSLLKLLKSKCRDVRRNSIKSLSQINSDKAKDCFVEALSDSDSHVRKTAVTALGKIGDAAAFEPLMHMLKNETYADVIDEFIIALSNIDSALFLSRQNELNDCIRKRVESHASGSGPEGTC